MDIENQVREIDMKQSSKCLIYTMYNKDFFLTKTIFYIVNYFYRPHKNIITVNNTKKSSKWHRLWVVIWLKKFDISIIDVCACSIAMISPWSGLLQPEYHSHWWWSTAPLMTAWGIQLDWICFSDWLWPTKKNKKHEQSWTTV